MYKLPLIQLKENYLIRIQSKFGAMMVIFESVTKKKVAHGTLQHILFISNNVNTELVYVLKVAFTFFFCFIDVGNEKGDVWWLPFFVLFMLVMQLFYLLNMVVTSFCFIHVDDDKGIYDDQKQLVYLFELGVSFTFYSRWQQQSNEDLKNKLEQTMSR
ncbi:uncharacterized protein BX664DRAFT_318705 [Halteromyces radiatus]|uniref:uncharacterized protein n=1 Tax=Halteromyces radiatus TaxID=101107 RepID=UPI00221F78A2|nr:uncharacterized protein BX664DRAFT_318705 [Halteromyces radiatus]KAI8075983.1 hypothetical protein BX664DRAFT_318705 [Halteromyces radiatus]